MRSLRALRPREPLCVLCGLCASVVSVCRVEFTTETQSTQRPHRELELSYYQAFPLSLFTFTLKGKYCNFLGPYAFDAKPLLYPTLSEPLPNLSVYKLRAGMVRGIMRFK